MLIMNQILYIYKLICDQNNPITGPATIPILQMIQLSLSELKLLKSGDDGTGTQAV